MRSHQLVALSIAGVISAVSLSGCSGSGLSESDIQACQAAQEGDARGVYALQSIIEDDDLKRNADRIKFGTSDSDDDEAMQDMLTICRDRGYDGAGGN